MFISHIAACSISMRLKGTGGEPIGGLYKGLSALLVGMVTWNPLMGVAWLLGIMPGLPEIGKLQTFDRVAWEQTIMRGAWNGTCLALVTGTIWPLVAGVSMPVLAGR